MSLLDTAYSSLLRHGCLVKLGHIYARILQIQAMVFSFVNVLDTAYVSRMIRHIGCQNQFETYVKSKDIDLWHIIVDGDYKPIFINTNTGRDETLPYERLNDDNKKMLSKNNEAKMVLYNALPKNEYERIFMCKTAKDIWNSLVITHQAFARFNTIITSLKALDESFSSYNHVRIFLRCLPTKWRPKVTVIEESKDLSTLFLDELISNLKVYEVVLEKDSEASKNKKEKYKSLALKEKMVSSYEDVSSSDSKGEEYAMAVRDFKKFFRRRGKFVRQSHDEINAFRKANEDKKGKVERKRFKCGDPNHFISDCPKHSYNDQKAFFGGSWSDSDEDEDLKKDEICLMAHDSNEVCLKVKFEPDEWIKDSRCARHMTGNKSLFSSYEAYDGGNIVFGSNEKSKIIGKDHGQEFDNEAFCDANGITHNFSAPRTPQSNGVVERKNRTLQEMSHTMLNEQSIPQKF
ncbi:zf-CCHC domain-containing protein [Tanacetum coccineum]